MLPRREDNLGAISGGLKAPCVQVEGMRCHETFLCVALCGVEVDLKTVTSPLRGLRHRPKQFVIYFFLYIYFFFSFLSYIYHF